VTAPSTASTLLGKSRPIAWWARPLAVPTRRLVLLSMVPLLLSVAVVFAPAVWIPVVALDIVLAALALLDRLLVSGTVQVSREYGHVQAVGRPFDVVLRVWNTGRRSVNLRFTDDPPGQAEGLPAEAQLPPEGGTEIRYRLTVDRRGQHTFGDLIVRFLSPLGIWERQERFELPGEVRLYPDFAQLRETELRGRLSEQRAPVAARRRPGGENEFQRLRPYVSGDPYRHIDWKATARKRDFVTREFGQESNQNLLFLLDCGRTMSSRSVGANGSSLTVFDHALNAAVLLGQVALKHGDRVGLLAFDRQIRAWLPPRGGARSAGRLIRATYDLHPSLEEPDYSLAFRYLTHQVRRRSLVVVLTASVDQVNSELASAMIRALGSRHLAVAVWMRDVEVDAMARAEHHDAPGPFLRGAAAELLGWRERALAELRHRGALVLDAAPEDLTPGLLHRYLEIKARRLL
jgi:uncharacterized protein (DUF58 family)